MSQEARELFGDAYPVISRYVDILASRGVDSGLLGPREANRLWDRHILNSAALSSTIENGASAVDVGSGAGLPGIPLAVLRPDVSMTLVEPLLRRFVFLQDVVTDLGLESQVSVVRTRAEDHDVTYDAVVSRALAPLTKLIGWCVPLCAPQGAVIALKGARAAEEIRSAQTLLSRRGLSAEVVHVRAHSLAEPTSAVVIRRQSSAGHRRVNTVCP